MRDGGDVKHGMQNVPDLPRGCVKIARGNHQTESLFPGQFRNFKGLRRIGLWHFFCSGEKLTCGRALAGPALAKRRTLAGRDEPIPSLKGNIL
jgi:hypothetical protein